MAGTRSNGNPWKFIKNYKCYNEITNLIEHKQRLDQDCRNN